MDSKKKKILINDSLLLNVSGEGDLHDYFCYQYCELYTDSNDFEFEIDVDFGNHAIPQFERTLAFDGGFISRAGAELYWVIGDSYVCLGGSSGLSGVKRIWFSGSFPKMKMNMLLEIVFRLFMSKKGIFLVHGAGVSKNSGGILLPAWKGVGKTALCLSLIEREFSFLADDRLWVDREGWLIANQRYVVIQDSNANYFPQFISIVDRLRRSFLAFFKSRKRLARSRFFKLVNRLLQVKPRYHKINDLYPNCDVTRKAALRSVVYMNKSNIHKDFFIEALEPSSLQLKLANISLYEWNLDIMKVALARDILFDCEPSWRVEIERFSDNERRGLLSILCKANCYEIHVPANCSSWDAARKLIEDL